MFSEIQVNDFIKLTADDYSLIDVRGEVPYNHGHIPGAILMDAHEVKERCDETG